MTDSRSKWLVGSSKNKTSGSTNNALAILHLILHPPLRLLILFYIISLGKPKPNKILVALVSALSASISYNLFYIAITSIAASFYSSSSALRSP